MIEENPFLVSLTVKVSLIIPPPILLRHRHKCQRLNKKSPRKKNTLIKGCDDKEEKKRLTVLIYSRVEINECP